MSASQSRTTTARGKRKLRIPYVDWRPTGAYFRIAIPKHARGEYPPKQTHIVKSLRTRDPEEAALKAIAMSRHFKALFGQNKINIESPDLILFRQLAERILGQAYLPITGPAASAKQFVESIGAGVHAHANAGERPSKLVVAAAVGAIDLPTLTMTQALERYQFLKRDKFSGVKTERARYKKWRPFVAAVDEWNRAMGKDRDVVKLTVSDVWEYKAKLVQLIEAKKFDVFTARKKLMWLKLILKTVFEVDHLRDTTPFDNVKIEGPSKPPKKVRAFTDEEYIAVRREFEKSSCGQELKALNTLMSLTGTSAKEVVLLTPGDIFVDDPVPYIRIADNEYRDQVKCGGERHRDIPLMPRALEVMKRFRKGFPHYRAQENGAENMGELSNNIIQRVAPTRSTYSYRHYLAARLRRCPTIRDTMQNALMGHVSLGMIMKYGDEFSLENKLEALKVAFPEEFTPIINP